MCVRFFGCLQLLVHENSDCSLKWTENSNTVNVRWSLVVPKRVHYVAISLPIPCDSMCACAFDWAFTPVIIVHIDLCSAMKISNKSQVFLFLSFSIMKISFKYCLFCCTFVDFVARISWMKQIDYNMRLLDTVSDYFVGDAVELLRLASIETIVLRCANSGFKNRINKHSQVQNNDVLTRNRIDTIHLKSKIYTIYCSILMHVHVWMYFVTQTLMLMLFFVCAFVVWECKFINWAKVNVRKWMAMFVFLVHQRNRHKHTD